MGLVTRCPACGTMFKVVADQLRVSQGWVRCGSCSDVFDASAHFQSAMPAAVDERPAANDEPSHPAFVEVAPESQPTGASDPLDLERRAAEIRPEPTSQTKPVDEVGEVNIAAGFESMAGSVAAHEVEVEVEAVERSPDYRDLSFVRKAQRKAFWHQPVVKVALATFATALAVVLGGQLILQHRDQIAVLEPRSVAVLQALCRPVGCGIKPLRRIEALVIDSASFTKLDSNSFRLGFVLKNTSDTPLEAPLLELTLSDNQDKTVLRRVLSPAQFGLRAGDLLPVHSETSGSVNLAVVPDSNRENTVSAAMVEGYRVLVFYP